METSVVICNPVKVLALSNVFYYIDFTITACPLNQLLTDSEYLRLIDVRPGLQASLVINWVCSPELTKPCFLIPWN
jgi:hypothetical protein